MKRLLLAMMLLGAMCVANSAYAQSASKPKKFHGNPDYYLEVQGAKIFSHVDKALDECPPVVDAPLARKSALFCLDALLHDTRYDNSPAMREFVNSRVEKLLVELKKSTKKGLKIYKIYNESFLARTKSVCVAFDLVRGTYLDRGKHKGTDYRIVTDAQMEAIIAKSDVLFLSHRHGDHVDRWVVDKFIAAGKPVIAATNILPDVEGVSHWRSEESIFKQELTLKSGKKLKVHILPGHQGKLLNNIAVVTTPENYTVCHTGDQASREDFKWLTTTELDIPKIDALMINCWTGKIAHLLKSFDARYVITGHENEMGHSIDHREAFWLTFDKLKSTKYPYVVMAWGEWFAIK